MQLLSSSKNNCVGEREKFFLLSLYMFVQGENDTDTQDHSTRLGSIDVSD